MNTEVIITCPVTGGGDTADKHPGLPITPEQIATAAIEAAKAGAAIAHIHARDPATGKNSRDPKFFREIVARIRESETDLVINLTGGNGGDWYPSEADPNVGSAESDFIGPIERLAYIEELMPEIGTVDCATMAFGEGLFLNPPDYLRVVLRRMQELKIKPELEAFDLGQMRLARKFCDEGLIDGAPLFQLCLGVPWGAAATTTAMMAMRDELPPGAIWASFGISRMQMPMAAQAVILGGNVRVGLEDNLYLSRGVLASNAQLVEKAVTIVEGLGARILSPQEAREKLGLIKHV
jgi:uncharacterized protein (DUF849 family)